MTPQELAKHKQAPKRLAALPAFKSLKKSSKNPKPFHKMGGARFQWSEVVAVSDIHRIVFIWRDGELRTDASFFAYLFLATQNNELYPLTEFHFHPSHKGGHMKVPCETIYEYEGRFLKGAPELQISGLEMLDPRLEKHQSILIDRFCRAVGIKTGKDDGLWN
jgi:hypothetical protein